MQSKISSSIIKNSNLITEAPKDDKVYVRKNGVWVDLKSTGLIPDESTSDGSSSKYEKLEGVLLSTGGFDSNGSLRELKNYYLYDGGFFKEWGGLVSKNRFTFKFSLIADYIMWSNFSYVIKSKLVTPLKIDIATWTKFNTNFRYGLVGKNISYSLSSGEIKSGVISIELISNSTFEYRGDRCFIDLVFSGSDHKQHGAYILPSSMSLTVRQETTNVEVTASQIVNV